MNSSNAKDYLPLVQAMADGKVIQGKFLDGWQDLNVVYFDMDACTYRIKPEPREIWVNRYADGLDGPVIYPTEDSAKHCGPQGSRAIKYREIIE